MQFPMPPAITNTALQRPSGLEMKFVARAMIIATVNTPQMIINGMRALPPLRKPKAAPELWTFTTLITPGISSLTVLSSGILPATQYLTH